MMLFRLNKKPSEIMICPEKGKEMSNLAEKCLKFKWIESQPKNLNRILTPCAFCLEVKISGNNCFDCKIPKSICDKDGNSGLIGHLLSKYGNILLKNIDEKEYYLVRKALISIFEEGELSILIKSEIENL